MVNEYFTNLGNIPEAKLRQENKTRLGTQKAADASVIRNKVLESFLVFLLNHFALMCCTDCGVIAFKFFSDC